MSDTDPSTAAQALVDTFNAIASPTLDDINTLTAGIANILNEDGITSDQISAVTIILTTVLQTNSTLTGTNYTFVQVESAQMTPVMNVKFLAAVNLVWASAGLDSSLLSTVNTLITPLMSSTTSVSQGDYDSLWTSISSALTDGDVSSTDIASMKIKFDATLTLYSNINYSNLMTASLSESTILDWMASLGVPLLSTYNVGIDFPQINMSITNFLINNGLDDDGMTTVEFISACEDILAYLSAYLTSDQIADIKTSMDSYISENFFTSTTYGDTMYLSTATTLTSTVSVNFGVSAIPLAPNAASAFITLVPTVLYIYPFTTDQTATINAAITSSIAGIDYTKIGLTAAQAGDIWTAIKTAATPFITDQGDTTASMFLTLLQTMFTNSLQSVVSQNVSNILGSTALINDIWQEFVFTNPSTGDLSFTGDYVSDWATAFIAAVSPDLGETSSLLLAFGLEEMLNSNNNLTNGLSGQNFLQIGNEILLFVSNFLTQTEVDEIATQLTNFLVTFVYVSDYVATVDEALIIGAIIVVVIVLVVATVLTGGALVGADVAAVSAAAMAAGDVAVAAGEGLATAAEVTAASAAFSASVIGIGALVTTTTQIVTVAVSMFIILAGLSAGAYGVDVVADDSSPS